MFHIKSTSVDNSWDYMDCCLTLLKGLGNISKNIINYQSNATSTKSTYHFYLYCFIRDKITNILWRCVCTLLEPYFYKIPTYTYTQVSSLKYPGTLFFHWGKGDIIIRLARTIIKILATCANGNYVGMLMLLYAQCKKVN